MSPDYPDECEGCGATDKPLRSIKMDDLSREELCEDCFEQAREQGRVHWQDPRVRGGRP